MIKLLVGLCLCGIAVPGFRRRSGFRRYRLDIDIDGAGVIYDYTGTIVILCWFSQIEKCVKRLNAVLYHLLSDVDLVVSSWLFVSLRRRR